MPGDGVLREIRTDVWGPIRSETRSMCVCLTETPSHDRLRLSRKSLEPNELTSILCSSRQQYPVRRQCACWFCWRHRFAIESVW